mgnify:CR=1 FL=1
MDWDSASGRLEKWRRKTSSIRKIFKLFFSGFGINRSRDAKKMNNFSYFGNPIGENKKGRMLHIG